VAEWLNAPHSKFGDGDYLADCPVPIRLNRLFIFELGPSPDAVLSSVVLSSSVAKW